MVCFIFLLLICHRFFNHDCFHRRRPFTQLIFYQQLKVYRYANFLVFIIKTQHCDLLSIYEQTFSTSSPTILVENTFSEGAVTCPAGYYAPQGAERCSQCPENTFSRVSLANASRANL